MDPRTLTRVPREELSLHERDKGDITTERRTPNRSPLGDLIRSQNRLSPPHAERTLGLSRSRFPWKHCFVGDSVGKLCQPIRNHTCRRFRRILRRQPTQRSAKSGVAGKTNMLHDWPIVSIFTSSPRSVRYGTRKPTATRFPFTRVMTTLKKCVGIGSRHAIFGSRTGIGPAGPLETFLRNRGTNLVLLSTPGRGPDATSVV